MNERHHFVRNAFIALGLSLPLVGAVGAQVYPGRSSAPASNPPSDFWRNLDASADTSASTSVVNPEGNNLLKEKSTLADLGQWTKTEGEDGQEILTAQTEDGFWANIAIKQEPKAWSAESYAYGLLARLRKVDSDARLLTSGMKTEKIKIRKGEYLVTARSKQSPESDGLDSLTYLLVVPTGQFDEEVVVYILTMQAPRNPKEMDYENQAVKALRGLAENRAENFSFVN